MTIRTFHILVVFLLFSAHLSAKVEKVFARATKYHKNDSVNDPNTKKGLTSTAIKLKDSCDESIGMVAVDPNVIPYGSLVYSPDTKRLFIACDVGEAVIDRTAAKDLAKEKGLGSKYQNALVLDFYSTEEILDNHYGDFYVIKYSGDKPFYKLYKKYQDKRLDPEFWIEEIKNIKKDKISLQEIKKSLIKASS